jgi:hypothetical protein
VVKFILAHNDLGTQKKAAPKKTAKTAVKAAPKVAAKTTAKRAVKAVAKKAPARKK